MTALSPADLHAAVAAEAALRAHDPLRQALAHRLTARQSAWLRSTARERVAEGGNQSGKTWASCVDFLSQAIGCHPTIRWSPRPEAPTWRGWYATTTYELFAEQGWGHWRRLLLYPQESMHNLPTRRVLEVGWDKKAPERPKFLRLRRVDGTEAEIWIKSYDQGRGEFQSAEVDLLALDEEAPEEIYEEVQPRVLARSGRISISATPVLGVQWLENLRAEAEAGRGGVYHCRFPTNENPALAPAAVAALVDRYRDRPEIARLRLEGYPVALEGRVYPDRLFTPEHLCAPVSLPAHWLRARCIDHGFRVTACLWHAYGPSGHVVAYREYYGEEKRIAENAAAILALEKGETITVKWIDPAALGTQQESGRRVIDVYNEHGVDVTPAPDNRVQSGIERVGDLLSEHDADGQRRFRVFRTLDRFLRERREYRWSELRPKGDAGPDRPVKRSDHLMDCWRYLVAGNLTYAPPQPPVPPPGTVGHRLWKARRDALPKEPPL